MNSLIHYKIQQKLTFTQPFYIPQHFPHPLQPYFQFPSTHIQYNNPYNLFIQSEYLIKALNSLSAMNDDPNNQQSQAASYIQTQFFFYMLTCYYAIFAFSVRYNKIMKDSPQINVNRIPGQFLITCLQNQPQFVPGVKDQPPPASYVIKSKFCLLNSYLYLFMTFFTFVGTQDLFYACKHRRFGIIYMFGFIAWSFAAIILRREYQRHLNQSLWTHRIFWIFSGTFAITKMFQDYLLPMNLILNCVSISSNFVLAVYGIYRPQDNDTLTLIDNQEVPGMFKLFFQYLELNGFLRKILRIQQPVSQGLKQTIDPDNLGEIDMKTLQQAFKVTTQSRRDQINLLNQLPRRNIFIDKKLQYLKNPNGTVKICYFIFSQIGNNRFQASRTFKQFVKLEDDLVIVFNDKNFPKVTLPKLKKTDTSQSSNQCQILEQWLMQLVKKPLFMIKPLLSFLNINEQSSAPFMTYFQVSYKSFCSNTFMLAQLKKRQARTSRVSLVGYYDEQNDTTPGSMKITNYIKQKIQFIVQNDNDITDNNQFGFLMTCIRETKNKQRIRWKLRKYQQNILQVNYRIEDECKLSIPFYYTMIANLSNKNHKLKAKAYCEYIQKLLDDQRYYCISLFQFIRFDPVTFQVKISGMGVSLSKTTLQTQAKRDSHYFQEYEDHGETVNVLRVDRTSAQGQPNVFKFQIRRRHFTLLRTSQDILKLRKQLAEIYQGVSFVPAITYEQCSKSQAKQRTQKFLTALEFLPKITINQSFAQFYHHTL